MRTTFGCDSSLSTRCRSLKMAEKLVREKERPKEVQTPDPLKWWAEEGEGKEGQGGEKSSRHKSPQLPSFFFSIEAILSSPKFKKLRWGYPGTRTKKGRPGRTWGGEVDVSKKGM